MFKPKKYIYREKIQQKILSMPFYAAALFFVFICLGLCSKPASAYDFTDGDNCFNLDSSTTASDYNFYDDFEDASIDSDKWKTVGTVTETSGYIAIEDTSYFDNYIHSKYGSARDSTWSFKFQEEDTNSVNFFIGATSEEAVFVGADAYYMYQSDLNTDLEFKYGNTKLDTWSVSIPDLEIINATVYINSSGGAAIKTCSPSLGCFTTYELGGSGSAAEYNFTMTHGPDANSLEIRVLEVRNHDGTPDQCPLQAAAGNPPSISLNRSVNGTLNNTNPFIIPLYADDPDDDANIGCSVYNNSDLLAVSEVSDEQTTFLNISTTSGVQKFPYLNVTCWDNSAENKSSDSILLNITIDTVLPAITLTSSYNNTGLIREQQDIDIDAVCTDDYPLRFNASLINSSGDVVESFQYDNLTTSERIDLDPAAIDISGYAPGQYRLNYTCVDGHTHSTPKIRDVYKSQDLNSGILGYTTLDNNYVEIKLIDSSVPLCDFGSYDSGDREIFWYDLYSCSKSAVLSGEPYYIFHVEGDHLEYLENSKYNGHFVTKDNFITFHLESDYPLKYEITKISDKDSKRDEYLVRIDTWERYLDFRHSIGGLNRLDVFEVFNITSLTYDNIYEIDYYQGGGSFIFDSEDYIEFVQFSFNVTLGGEYDLRSSVNVKKDTRPQSSDVYARYLIDDVEATEQLLRTVDSTDDTGSVAIRPLNVTLLPGNNNITVYVKDTGQGSINISRFSIHLSSKEVVENSPEEITSDYGNATVLIPSTAYSKVYSINVSRNYTYEPFYIDIKGIITADGTGTVRCRLNNSDGSGFRSVETIRTVSAGSIASAGIVTMDNTSDCIDCSYDLICRQSGGLTAQYNFTYLSAFHSNRDDDDFTRTEIYGHRINRSDQAAAAGVDTVLLQHSHDQRKGDDLEFWIHTTAESTSSSDLYIWVEDSSGADIGGHYRYFSAASEYGSIDFYVNYSLAAGSTETFYLRARGTDDFNSISSEMVMHESISVNSSIGSRPPVVSIRYPMDNAELKGFDFINFTVSDINDNDWHTNITLSNSSNTTDIFSELLKGNRSVRYNFTRFSVGSYNLNVTAYEKGTTELYVSSSDIDISVVGLTVENSFPSNGSIVSDESQGDFIFTVDEADKSCGLYIDGLINETINSSVSGPNTFSDISYPALNGSFEWNVGCLWDDGNYYYSDNFTLTIEETDRGALSVRTCPVSSTPSSILLSVFILISISLIFIGIFSDIGIMGFFGSIMLMVLSWYIAPCIALLGYVVALFSFFLIIWFSFRGLGFHNDTYN